MAKNSIEQIEEDEQKVLDQLSKNANKSVNDIAKICNFSRQKVWRIIKKLEENDTIWGYTAVLDNIKLNKKSYIMLIKKTNEPVTKRLVQDVTSRNVAKEVKKSGVDIVCSHYTHGYYDWVICFNCNNLIDAKAFVEYYNKLYQGFISDVNLIEVMFSAVSAGIRNPKIDKLNDFFKI